MTNQTAQKCKEILTNNDIDTLSTVEFNVNEKIHTFTFEEIIDIYMQASEESQLVFLTALQKASDVENMGIDKFFEGMGQLLLMTHLSDKIEV
jgi:hypothetical protein